MDLPQPVSPELEQDLANLRSLNRNFGAERLLHFFLKRWCRPGQTYHFLDLATGSADLPLAALQWADRNGVDLQWDALDKHPATLEIAGTHLGDLPRIRLIEGDVLTWDSGRRYDAVFCNLALHHFSDADAETILRRMRALSSGAIMASDLRRSIGLKTGVWLLTTLLYREPMTRHDARLSCRRAFSSRELKTLAEQSGWKQWHHRRFPFHRQAIWVDPPGQ